MTKCTDSFRHKLKAILQLIIYGANPDDDEQKWQLVRALNLLEEPEPC